MFVTLSHCHIKALITLKVPSPLPRCQSSQLWSSHLQGFLPRSCSGYLPVVACTCCSALSHVPPWESWAGLWEGSEPWLPLFVGSLGCSGCGRRAPSKLVLRPVASHLEVCATLWHGELSFPCRCSRIGQISQDPWLLSIGSSMWEPRPGLCVLRPFSG